MISADGLAQPRLKMSRLHLTLRGVDLAAKDRRRDKQGNTRGSSDPYLRVFAASAAAAPDKPSLHTTEHVDDSLTPRWQTFRLDLQELCSGDRDAAFRVECWDKDWKKADDLIGWSLVTGACLRVGGRRRAVCVLLCVHVCVHLCVRVHWLARV